MDRVTHLYANPCSHPELVTLAVRSPVTYDVAHQFCGVQLGISLGVSALQVSFVFSISSAGIIPPWLGLALLHLEILTEAMLLLHMGFLAPYEHEGELAFIFICLPLHFLRILLTI